MRRASPTSARRPTNWCGRLTRTRFPTPIPFPPLSRPSARACSPTGAASIPALQAQMKATTPCNWRRAIACRAAWTSIPDSPGPRLWPTTRAPTILASAARAVGSAPPRSSIATSTTVTYTEPAASVGIPPPCMTCPLAAARCWAPRCRGLPIWRLADGG